jgi:hypothetical protein
MGPRGSGDPPALTPANLLSNSAKFLQSAVGSLVGQGSQSTALAQVLGGQLTNGLTNVGNVANLLQQGNGAAGGSQTTPDISGSAPLRGQPNNNQNLMLANKH